VFAKFKKHWARCMLIRVGIAEEEQMPKQSANAVFGHRCTELLHNEKNEDL